MVHHIQQSNCVDNGLFKYCVSSFSPYPDHLLHPSHYGFRAGRSTATALIEICEDEAIGFWGFCNKLVKQQNIQGVCGGITIRTTKLDPGVPQGSILGLLLLSNSTPTCKPNSTSVGVSRSWFCFPKEGRKKKKEPSPSYLGQTCFFFIQMIYQK